MSASAILVFTALVVLFVLAVALLAGSLALLSAGARAPDSQRSGLLEALRLLDRQWRIERLVYRHHRLFGTLVIAGGTFCLWQLARPELSDVLAGYSTASVLAWALLLGQAFNLIVGLVLLLRPSLLKPVEAFSNRWHHLDRTAPGRAKQTRLTALFLALIGLVVLLGSATLLVQQVTGLVR